LREFGFEIEYDRIRRLIGKGGDKLLFELTRIDIESSLGQSIAKRRTARFKEKYLPTLRPFPHARELVQALRQNHQLVVATSAGAQEMEALLERAQVADLIEHATNKDDAENSKPDPDIVHAALARGHCQKDDAVLIGDTPFDCAAAKRAGIHAIAFRSGGWADDTLDDADEIYDGPEDLLRHLDDSALLHP
jgi:HAD superfamily hydrolase (TIGR01509 family)